MIAMSIPINGKTALGRPEVDSEVEPGPGVTIASR
jgi:hypothetical protein